MSDRSGQQIVTLTTIWWWQKLGTGRQWLNKQRTAFICKEQCHVEVSNRVAALEDLDTEVDINRAWGTIREIIKISAKESLGYYELKKHKP
jgi:hypothetical protein